MLKESDLKKLAPKERRYMLADLDGLYGGDVSKWTQLE